MDEWESVRGRYDERGTPTLEERVHRVLEEEGLRQRALAAGTDALKLSQMTCTVVSLLTAVLASFAVYFLTGSLRGIDYPEQQDAGLFCALLTVIAGMLLLLVVWHWRENSRTFAKLMSSSSS